MVNLAQLEALIAVVDAGGISGAAKAMYLSQPSVSNQIRNLENGLGVQLLERTPQGARPTRAGMVAVQHARDILAQLATLERDVQALHGVAAGRVVVAGTTGLGTYLLPHLIAEFTSQLPSIDCQLRVGNEESVENWVLRGEVSLALCAEEPGEDELLAEPMFEEAMLLVANPDSALVGRPLAPGDLAAERFLMREAGSATRRQQEAALQLWSLGTVKRWDLWGPETLKESVHAGLGVALLSEHVTARERALGRLVALSVDPPPPSRTVYLVRKAHRALTPAEESFTALIKRTTSWPGVASD